MCGICGVVNLGEAERPQKRIIHQMLEMLHHRGPDGFGIYSDAQAALGNARLSIIDLATGDQPIANEDETLWIVFNGEIFNYIELRADLEQRGHRFRTHSDTEVILHLYEDLGPACLERFNGQFAIAIWDRRSRSLFLARDRLGVRPLFYARARNRLLFGSEMKSILAYPGQRAELDPQALQEVFTFWSVQSPRTIFKGIAELPPGHYLLTSPEKFEIHPYWQPDFTPPAPPRPAKEYLEQLESLLIDAARIRLRADVPVGAYLSGGLDSSLVAALIRRYGQSQLETFSIAFSDPAFDESAFQQEVAAFLGTRHNVIECTYEQIGQVFPQVVWHAEAPLLRTAPAPMFLLSGLVRSKNFKVVLTGEGADETLAGYDLFKEMRLRRFWARQPNSKLRPLLLHRIYRDIANLSDRQMSFLESFFRQGLTETDSPYYSHLIRWNNTRRLTRFLREPPQPFTHPNQPLPAAFSRWTPLAQAQYLEISTFLSPYLLSSQGDRMAMGNSVEGRYPFLDYRMVEFASRLPDWLKLRGLTEKYLLKQLGAKYLPETIWQRGKKPYRAPIRQAFFAQPPDYLTDLLAEKNLAETGYFQTAAVRALMDKAARLETLSEVDSMAVAGIISTLLLHQFFIKEFRPNPLREEHIQRHVVL
ncbi:MAG: asparagine synthase (glutamine-hydrolyzing) [Anaerolineales bacterium]